MNDRQQYKHLTSKSHVYYHVYLLQITMNVKKLDKVAVHRDVETQLVVLTAFVVQGIALMQMDHPVMVGCFLKKRGLAWRL